MPIKGVELKETYRGIQINYLPSERDYHLGLTYTRHKSVEECREEIDRIMMKRTLRSKVNPDIVSVFDNERGECVQVGDGLKVVEIVSENDKDLAGLEYYRIDNPYVTEDDDYLTFRFKSFIGRVADAIQAIREGYGDALQTSHGMFGNMENVVRFINRKRGEEIRQKSIEGWANADFSWVVKFYSGNSECWVGDKNTAIPTFLYDGLKKPLEFGTRDGAKKYIAEILESEIRGYDKYKDDEESRSKYLESLDSTAFQSIPLRAFLSSLDLEEGVKGSGYSFTVEQWLHRKSEDATNEEELNV